MNAVSFFKQSGVASILATVFEIDYEYLSRCCDAVESVRTKLRGYILAVKIAETLQAQELKQKAAQAVQEEGQAPPAKVQRVETPIRPPGMPPMMPWMPSGESGVTAATWSQLFRSTHYIPMYFN